jgi:ligand-binding SRPBCC domain-containing protein
MITKGFYHLHREQYIPRPLAEVFPFFADAGNLEAITPPWLNFRILTPQPIKVQAGTLIDYRLALFGVPLAWRTRIEAFDPPQRFIDRQVWGPYKLWHHTHEFREADGGTWMTDHVEYKLFLGPIGWAANAVMVRRMLDRIFDYRQQAIQRLLCQSLPKANALCSPTRSKLATDSVT